MSCPRDISFSISRGHASAANATTSAMEGATSNGIQLSRELVGAADSHTAFVITTVTY